MPSERQSRHFGVLSFTGTGHINPLIVLSQELSQRGHRVTFFERPKIGDRIRQAGLEFVPVCADRSGIVKPELRGPGMWSEFTILRFNVKRVMRDVESYLREMPAALAQAGIDALIVDEIALTGPTLAEQLRLPYIVISTSVPHICGWDAYPWFAGYRHVTSPLSRVQRAILEQSALRAHGPFRRTLDRHRKSAGLQSIRRLRETYPPLAHITQLPQRLDLPDVSLPPHFHYTGPFVSGEARPPIDFPWHRLDGRPVIYASLGTTANVQAGIFRLIAEACLDLYLQLIISLGGRFDPEQFADLPGRPLVVRFAPQLELLRLASLVITHGGSNTVFETLMEGKPMVAIPIAHDQPAIAARLARARAGVVLPIMRLSANRIRSAILTVLRDPAYRDAAATIQRTIRGLRGAEQAVNIIEDALQNSEADRHPEVGEYIHVGS
jgi:zeaxanthin glucosyltransferase